MQWQKNTFFDHLDKFGNALGAENFGIAFCLSTISWESTQDRDTFIKSLTGIDPQDNSESNFSPGSVVK